MEWKVCLFCLCVLDNGIKHITDTWLMFCLLFLCPVDCESISLHGEADSISLHHLSHGNNPSDFDKSSTIPRNSDLSFQYRKFTWSKRPSSTVSLFTEPVLIGGSVHHLSPHTATIRRKPSSKPTYRRGTISGGVPIPISTPQIPNKAIPGNGGSEENVFTALSAAEGLGHSKLCTSTQSLSALSPSSSSPYYQHVLGQMPVPVAIPTVPSYPPEDGSATQQQCRQQYQINQQLNQQQQQHSQLQYRHQSLLQHGQQLQHKPARYQQGDQLLQQEDMLSGQKTQLQSSVTQGDDSDLAYNPQHQPQDFSPSTQEPDPLAHESRTEDMLTLIRGVKLKRTQTSDRSAPLLSPPVNLK